MQYYKCTHQCVVHNRAYNRPPGALRASLRPTAGRWNTCYRRQSETGVLGAKESDRAGCDVMIYLVLLESGRVLEDIYAEHDNTGCRWIENTRIADL